MIDTAQGAGEAAGCPFMLCTAQAAKPSSLTALQWAALFSTAQVCCRQGVQRCHMPVHGRSPDAPASHQRLVG